MSSNTTSTKRATDPPSTSTTAKPPSTIANPTTTASTPPTSAPPTTTTSDPPTTTTTTPPTSNPPTTTPPTSSTPPPTSETPPSTQSQFTTTSQDRTSTTTRVISTVPTESTSPTFSQTASSTSGGPAISPTSGSSNGLDDKSKIAVAVVVPIAAVALLVLAGIFFWRKRKQRKDAAEQRRKEVEDYGYNPNADPSIPALAAAGGPFEMKDDASSGYRGWGSTTLAGSGRKASTTMSGGPGGVSYSDASPTRANHSDTRSGEPLMHDGSVSPEGEILGAMGPSAASNRADVRRGPSNASSSYSAGARSDGSGEGGPTYGGGAGYYDQYGNSNPYTDGRPEGASPGTQPVIRDVSARRNTTRIENSAHYPQQSAGISQNF